jgi:hypothetical protein
MDMRERTIEARPPDREGPGQWYPMPEHPGDWLWWDGVHYVARSFQGDDGRWVRLPVPPGVPAPLAELDDQGEDRLTPAVRLFQPRPPHRNEAGWWCPIRQHPGEWLWWDGKTYTVRTFQTKDGTWVERPAPSGVSIPPGKHGAPVKDPDRWLKVLAVVIVTVLLLILFGWLLLQAAGNDVWNHVNM